MSNWRPKKSLFYPRLPAVPHWAGEYHCKAGARLSHKLCQNCLLSSMASTSPAYLPTGTEAWWWHLVHTGLQDECKWSYLGIHLPSVCSEMRECQKCAFQSDPWLWIGIKVSQEYSENWSAQACQEHLRDKTETSCMKYEANVRVKHYLSTGEPTKVVKQL